jgi:GNAT superfamily N-acetyltransferase
VEVRAIRESEYEECLDLWEKVFGDGRAYFERYFTGDPDFQPEYTRCCFAGGRMIAAAQICRRVVACGEFTLTMGGIANVATLKEHRGKGYNTACLRDALRIMEADAMDFSLLFTGIHGFYARLGWETVALSYLSGDIREKFSPTLSDIAVRPNEAQDDEAIRGLYAQFNRTRPIAARRSGPYWRGWIGWHDGKAPGEARVAERGGSVVGYSLSRLREDRLEIFEAGAADGEKEAIGALLEEAAADALRNGVRRILFYLPATPEVRAAAERIFENIERQKRGGGMVRFLQPDTMLRGLIPELTDRWMRADAPPGVLTFDTPCGAICLEACSGLLSVAPADDRRGALSQADLFALLTGMGLSQGRPDSQNAAFAAALFPPFDAWYWALDGF